MKSSTPQQATWKTSDGSPWWLRSTRYSEPNGDYHGNCFLNLHSNPASADTLHFNDHNCNYHSRSYYCQPRKNDKNYGGHHRRRRGVKAPPKPKVVKKIKAKGIKAPFGVQINYNQLTLIKAGWKTWSDFPYSHHTVLKDIQPVSGECVMWGSKRNSGMTTLALAAFGRRKTIEGKRRVFENGVNWYTEYGKSNGFTKHKSVSLNSADTQNLQSEFRLSWHLHKRGRVGGYRSGRTKGLNGDSRWRKVVMYGPCKMAAARCQWLATPIKGSIKGNNVGSAHTGKTLSQCRALCSAEPKCKSIDYSASKRRCYLGSCQLGDKGCRNDNDAAYTLHNCQAAARCQWLAAPIKGSIKGHNIGSAHKDKTLAQCRALCSAERNCKSIDYSASKRRCYLGSCQLGDKGCRNDNDAAYSLHNCQAL